MARRRFYRRYVRAAPKKKWASCIYQNVVNTSNYQTIVENSTQNSTPTPVVIKCGNFKVQGDAMWASIASTTAPAVMTFFLIFVPEGVSPSDALITTHPEWVLAWRTIDVGILKNSEGAPATQTSSFSVSSRLKRNLNSGDKVVALLQTNNASLSGQCAFTCQYWTCAN